MQLIERASLYKRYKKYLDWHSLGNARFEDLWKQMSQIEAWSCALKRFLLNQKIARKVKMKARAHPTAIPMISPCVRASASIPPEKESQKPRVKIVALKKVIRSNIISKNLGYFPCHMILLVHIVQ